MRVEEARADYLATLVGQKGWPEMAIEEIADLNPRVDKASIPDDLPVSFVPMPAVGAADGSIHVEETRPAGEVRKGFTAFLEGDVLFAKITPCMENGKMAVVPKLVNGFGFGSTEFHVLRPKPGIDAKYLYYYVSSQSFRGEAERHMTGAVGQRRVPTTYLKECKIPVAPLDQQKRIVAEIEKQFSRLDEAVANLKRVKANLKRYKAAVLKAAVEGRLVETEAELARREGRRYETGEQLLQRILETRRSQWQGKGKYKEPASPDTADLPELPEGWVWATADQLCSQITDGEHIQPRYQSTGFPMLTAKNVRDGHVDFGDVGYIAKEDFKACLKRCAPVERDILVVSVGATTGRTAIVGACQPFALVRSVLLLRAEQMVTEQYLLYWLQSPWCQTHIQRASGSTAQAHLYIRDTKTIPVPFPPVSEQHRLVAEVDRRLTLLRETETQVGVNLKRAERLRQSILRQAFSGHALPPITPTRLRA